MKKDTRDIITRGYCTNDIIKYGHTIDMNYIKYSKHCGKATFQILFDFMQRMNPLRFVLFLFIILLIGKLIGLDKAYTQDIQTEIRIERLETCKQAYEQDLFGKIAKYHTADEKEKLKKDYSVKCATYNTLMYAFESNFGNSKICKEKKNCYGIGGDDNLKTFESYKQANEFYAQKYFEWHFRKDTYTFVTNWVCGENCNGNSKAKEGRDNEYVFITERFESVYSEIESLYFKIK